MSESPREGANRNPGLFRNYLSFAGAALACATLSSILFLVLLDMLGAENSPYLGIFTYILLPSVMLFGISLVPLGMLWERRRRRRSGAAELPTYPILDLNDPRRRRSFLAFLGVSFFFLLLSAFGSYHAYEYTESVAFCGELCHTPMRPELVVFKVAPHARIRCVDCHVGEGAEWFVRSKVSGVHQLMGVVLNDYPKPIPTPVENLRPARDTCEHCHSPDVFYGDQLRVFEHYGYDEGNTPSRTRLLMKTGGINPAVGPPTGIHWHMNLSSTITYVASDRERGHIPWVRLTDSKGNVTDFKVADAPAPDQNAIASARRMDCVDCHNRPTHMYVPPDQAVDRAFSSGRLDASLPFFKRESVAALTGNYATTEEAVASITSTLDAFYRTTYPDLYAARRGAVDSAIAEVGRIYQTYIFPEMKVTWQSHPDNIGHYYAQGCFRCHDGQHAAANGQVIRNDCALCHTTLDETFAGVTIPSSNGAYRHPVDLGAQSRLQCTTCHNGGGPFKHPLDLGDISQFKCSDCHQPVTDGASHESVGGR